MNSWEPLPPRRGRMDRRQRRQNNKLNSMQQQRPTNSSDHNSNNDGPESPEQTANVSLAKRTTPSKRPLSRPGFNSYLKVVLDEASLQQLRAATLQIASQFSDRTNERLQTTTSPESMATDSNLNPAPSTFASEQTLPAVASQDREFHDGDIPDQDDTGKSTTPANGDPDSSNKLLTSPKNSALRKRSLYIKPRSLQSLHMTFLFGGETLGALPAPALLRFHAELSQVLHDAGFFQRSVELHEHNGDNSAPEGKTTGTTTSLPTKSFPCTFRITRLRLFPPQRNNLIVAELEAPVAWHELYQHIRAVAKHAEYSPELRTIVAYSKEQWTPHITLATLMNKDKEKLRQLGQLLANFDMNINSSADNNSGVDDDDDSWRVATARCISMGGPIPQRLELDWTFYSLDV